MFDVFYLDRPTGLFPHERKVASIQEAMLLSRTRSLWLVNYLCDYAQFDFLWEPPPWQCDQRHAWASQWQKDCGTYLVPRQGYRDTHYHSTPLITRRPCSDNWIMPPHDIQGFDFSWHPDPTEPAMQYQFGTQHQITGGPRYDRGGSDIKYLDHPRCVKTTVDHNWHRPVGLDENSFDWTWHPDDRDPVYHYQFGTQWQKTGGPRYEMPGASQIKFVHQPRAHKISTDSCWRVPEHADTTSFDWTWHPDAADPAYIYQFGTQHQRTGGPRYCVTGATETKYVDQIKIRTQRTASAIYLIDHMDGNADQVRCQVPVDRVVRYFDDYLNTLRRIAKNAPPEQEFVWVISSVCDYRNFDFSWHPEQWQSGLLHVFASGDEKFGDTFFLHVPTFRYRSETCQLLEWYDLNFVPSRSVPRWPMPVIQHQEDSQVDAILGHDWTGPLALFSVTANLPESVPVVPLWREKTKTVTPLTPGATQVVIPRVARSRITTQVYDYPYIDNSHRGREDTPLDVVFLSNGEHGAEHHYQVLQHALESSRAQNRLHRIDGINGRVAAYQAAAQLSHTPWFFAVFAKLQVNTDFDWSWQPDRLQRPKHYIFHAYNPVNHLVYGHQAVIAYNRRMTLVNPGTGLDFTLDQPHEVVPVVSGTAFYDNDPWTCWRTAFRECVKLRHGLPDVENEYRLSQWLSQGDGVNGHWSMRGAQDAVDYYDGVKGDFAEIKKSYEWSWLAAYAMIVQPELVTQSRT